MRDVIVLPDPVAVADAASQRLASFLLEAQSLHSPVHVALTGGATGIAVLERLRPNPLLGAISWPDVHFWWGDERFVDAWSPDRNDLAARRALLDHLPEAPGGIHAMPSSDLGLSLDEAAARYSGELRHFNVVFDLVLLGVGPDGHVASIFPGRGDGSALAAPAAFAVPDSPKPPPSRVSLTLATINAAREVWLVAAGPAKRSAVAAALSARPAQGVDDAARPSCTVAPAPPLPSGAPPSTQSARSAPGSFLAEALPTAPPVPAALVAGRERTLWLIDAPAAGHAGDGTISCSP